DESLKTAVISESGDFLAVYFSNNSPAKVRNKLKISATAEWFDPRNGKTQSAGQFATNEAREMLPPDGWEDAILLLK
ncbi:MAG TPA: putative collagen-binding domain-containing protein, partial [Pyrinomonadaceae bacterium]|nr:putative collagen-binding domain-containing protein [Pyrinomonadaceae bacterium]